MLFMGTFSIICKYIGTYFLQGLGILINLTARLVEMTSVSDHQQQISLKVRQATILSSLDLLSDSLQVYGEFDHTEVLWVATL